MFASKSNGGFYDPEIHTSMPEDAVELPDGLHAKLMAGQSEGKIISWDKKGFPFLEDAPLPTRDELNAYVIANRAAAYSAEADPLFFQAQRGDVDNQVWLDKIAEIKARFPKV